MDDNHLRQLHCQQLLRHGSSIFPYFYFENTTFVEDSIRGISKTKMDKIYVKMKEVAVARRQVLCAEKNKRADTSVQFTNI